jgi:Zn-dependent protease
VSVYVHWSWLVIGLLIVQYRTREYDNYAWNVAEFLSLFGIVLLHEFGHALACRQVGGEADTIVLWPLGGYTLCVPPARPGPSLWTFAAGPLVNLVLAPVTIGIYFAAHANGLHQGDRELGHFLHALARINFLLLFFNMLPIYPLDGGQILQAILWFAIGRSASLTVVSIIGLIGAAGFVVLAVVLRDFWIGIIAVFAAIRCWSGIRQARLLAALETAPRHRGAHCPSCGVQPLIGPYWQCDRCGARFDAFLTHAECGACGKQFATTSCPECRKSHPIWAWYDQEGPPADWGERDH